MTRRIERIQACRGNSLTSARPYAKQTRYSRSGWVTVAGPAAAVRLATRVPPPRRLTR